MAFRTDLSVSIFIGIVCFYGILSREYNYTSDAGLIGMALSTSFGLTLFISFYL